MINLPLIQIQDFLLGLYRFRWIALLTALLLCVLGWVGIYLIPNKYESKAQVYIDTDTVLKPLLDGLAVNSHDQDRVRSMTQILLSRPNLEKVALNADLDFEANSEEEFSALLQRLKDKIIIQQVRVSREDINNIYEISYIDKNPNTAFSIVNSLISALVEKSIQGSKEDTELAQAFLQKQIKEYEERLTAAEQRLANFKKENVGLMPNSGQDYYSSLKTQEDTLRMLQTQLNSAINRRNELRRQLLGEEPVFGILGAGALSGSSKYDSQINEHEATLNTLLYKYTELHPEVVELKETIAELERLKQQELANMRALGVNTSQSLDMNPVFQTMKISLSQSEVDVKALQSEVSAQRGVVNRLRTQVDRIPEVEAELSKLDRDYETNKYKYEELLARLESARLSEQASLNSDDVKYQIIEPPLVPTQAVSPNRPLFIVAIFIMAVGFALFLAFLMSIYKPVYFSQTSLLNDLELPVIGEVSRSNGGVLTSPASDTTLVALSVAILISACVGAIYYSQFLINTSATL